MESSWTVAVTREIPDAGLRPLREATKVKLWDQELPPSAEELDELLEGCDGAITLLTDHIDGSVLDRHPSLRVISNFAVGYDNIDVPAATRARCACLQHSRRVDERDRRSHLGAAARGRAPHSRVDRLCP